jgi:hypothetical protein
LGFFAVGFLFPLLPTVSSRPELVPALLFFIRLTRLNIPGAVLAGVIFGSSATDDEELLSFATALMKETVLIIICVIYI